MEKFLAILGGLVVLALAFLLAPIGIAAAIDWSPAQTNVAMTGLFTVCGGGVAALALGFGLVAGIALLRDRRRDDAPPTYPPAYPPEVISNGRGSYSELEMLRAEKMRLDMHRQALAIERDRRALLPQAPPAPPAEDPWYSAAGDFQVIDGITAAGWDDDGASSPSGRW